MKNDLEPVQNSFILYTTPNGEVKLNVLFNDETIWLTQKMMSELFDVGVPAINKHLSNIFESSELDEHSVISILETTEFLSNSFSSNIFFKCFDIAGTPTSKTFDIPF